MLCPGREIDQHRKGANMKHENPTITYLQKKELVKLARALHGLTEFGEQADLLAFRILEACNYNTGAEMLEEALDIRFMPEHEISRGLQVLVDETNTRYQYHCGCMTELALQVLSCTNISYDKYSAIAKTLIDNL